MCPLAAQEPGKKSPLYRTSCQSYIITPVNKEPQSRLTVMRKHHESSSKSSGAEILFMAFLTCRQFHQKLSVVSNTIMSLPLFPFFNELRQDLLSQLSQILDKDALNLDPKNSVM